MELAIVVSTKLPVQKSLMCILYTYANKIGTRNTAISDLMFEKAVQYEEAFFLKV